LSIATFITNFGDLAVLLPIAVTVLTWLLWSPDSRRSGAAWAVAVVFCGGSIALLKVYFSACPTGTIDSPSGHAALSFLVYGALALIIAERSKQLTVPAIAAGLGLALAIAGSRIVIGAHDGVDVLIGLVIGGHCVGDLWNDPVPKSSTNSREISTRCGRPARDSAPWPRGSFRRTVPPCRWVFAPHKDNRLRFLTTEAATKFGAIANGW
jgi:PAP2 superfamily